MVPFATIRERAERRKGGADALARILGPARSNEAVAKVGDDRILSVMAERVFAAGFVWRVIEQKWPGFEEAFLGFQPKALLFQPDEFWQDLASDKRIVRNAQKISIMVKGTGREVLHPEEEQPLTDTSNEDSAMESTEETDSSIQSRVPARAAASGGRG